jgi:4-amino-4-deoxychorismate lyase
VPSGEFTSATLREGDEGELRRPFAGRWGHSVRSAKVGAGGQRGTSRRWALGKGFCMEEPVGKDTVEVGQGVWVSNGVRGFGFGRVVQ